MRAFLCVFGVLVLASCDRKAKIGQKIDAYVKSEMLAIDWNDVDTYPMFENCDETQTKQGQQACFEQELVQELKKALKVYEFNLPPNVNTVAHVEFVVDKEGIPGMVRVDKNPVIDNHIPEFDGIVARCLKSLPPLRPALKRGMPVNARFSIPFRFNTLESQ